MMKFIVCLIGWVLTPLAMLVVAFDIAKCWVEAKVNGKAQEQLEIQQGEILRLTIENQAAYQRGWSEAIKAATERTRRIFNEEND